MMAYLLKRILFAIPVLLLTAILVFLALHLSPGDPVDLLVSPLAPESVRQRVRIKLGLDKPLTEQFFIYMANIAQGNLGDSIINKQPVAELIKQKLPITAELGVAAFLLAYALAIPLGTIAAMNRNSILDWFSMITAMIGVSMPDFWLGLILMLVFAVTLKWLPATGYGSVAKLILPVLALGLPRVGRIARITRSSVLEVINQDYVRTAHSKGIPAFAVTTMHILRNSLIPIISLMGLDLGYIVGGAVVTEHVFARPGIGDLMLQSIYSRDFPVLQGCMFVLALAIILGNILADLLYVIVDPRISHESTQ